MADNQAIEKFNVTGLKQLLKALKEKPPVCRVGILGTTNARDDGKTNAEIGAGHEYGTNGLPKRSFLREPLTAHLGKELENSGILNQDTMLEVIKAGSVRPWLTKVAKIAESIVDDAFHTGGDGKWPAWKKEGYTNQTGQLLIDTGQLRRAITSEVK